jgi:hypothetical protein
LIPPKRGCARPTQAGFSGLDAAGQVIVRRQLKRRYVLAFFQKMQPCLVGIEACASSHHWSRELQALGNAMRTHLSLAKDAPNGRAIQRHGHIEVRPVLGGLHYQYVRI